MAFFDFKLISQSYHISFDKSNKKMHKAEIMLFLEG